MARVVAVICIAGSFCALSTPPPLPTVVALEARFLLELSPTLVILEYMRTKCLISRHHRARLFEMLLAVPILAVTGLGLVQFFWLLAASEALGQAAEAGAQEAALPKATYRSVSDAARRRLRGWSFAGAIDPIVVEIGGRAAYGVLEQRSGDEIAVTVSVASHRAAPDLLGRVGLPLFRQKLHSRRAFRVR